MRHHMRRIPGRGVGAEQGRLLPLMHLTLAVTALALLLPAAAQAQSSVRFLPQVGAYAPLFEVEQIRGEGETLIQAGRRSSSLSWGLGLEFGPAREGTSVRAGVGYGSNAQVPIWTVDCAGCSARSTLMTASLAAVFRPVPRLVLVQPYLIAGAGVKRNDVEFRDVRDDGAFVTLRDQARISGQLGVGLEASLLGLRTQWEVNGFMSRFGSGSSPGGGGSDFRLTGDQGLQTDLFLTLTIPLGG